MFFFAISSTVTEIKRLNLIPKIERNKNKYIALDMGHHQYSGRYIMTLKSVLNWMEKTFKERAAVILSFWKFKNSNIKSNWYVSNFKIKMKRLWKENDIIDILELK